MAGLSLFDPTILPQKKSTETVHLSKLFSPNIPVPLYDHVIENVINKNICIYGKPKSGKTFLVYSLLLALERHQYPIYLFGPTNTLGDNNFLPDFAHIRVTGDLGTRLKELIAEQMILADLYKSANDLPQIEAFIQRYDMGEVVKTEAERLNKYMRTQTAEKCVKYMQILIETIGRVVRKQNKKYSSPGDTMFAKMIGATPPYVVFIFDDCGKVRDTTSYENLSTNYRHNFISIINITQAQALVPRTLRLCSDVSIFCQLNYFIGALANNEVVLAVPNQNTWVRYAERIFKERYKFVVVNTSHTAQDQPIEYTAAKYLAGRSYYKIGDDAVQKKIKNSTPTRRMWILQYLAYEAQREEEIIK